MKRKILHFLCFACFFIAGLFSATPLGATLWGANAGMYLTQFIEDFFE